jgi:hypothetical protein
LSQSKVKRTNEDWADLLGKSKATITQYRQTNSNRERHIPWRVIKNAQLIAGNWCVSQWMDFDTQRVEPTLGSEEGQELEQRSYG